MTIFETIDVKTKWKLKQQPQQANTDTQKAKLWGSILLKLLSQEAFLAVGWAWGWKYSWRFPRAGTPNVSSCFPRLSSSRPLTGRRKWSSRQMGPVKREAFLPQTDTNPKTKDFSPERQLASLQTGSKRLLCEAEEPEGTEMAQVLQGPQSPSR